MVEVRKIFVLLIIIFLVPALAHAGISLGSIQQEKSAIIRAGEAADFKILLFSSSQTHVKLISKAPEGWDISINPKEFDLPTEENPEYVVLSGKYVKATPVYIKITSPFNTEGIYEIKVIAQAGSDSGGIATLQERDFSFKINILKEKGWIENVTEGMSQSPGIARNLTGSVMEEAIDKENLTEEENPKDSYRESNTTDGSGITGMITAYSTPILIWVIFLIIAIILLLWERGIKKSGVMT